MTTRASMFRMKATRKLGVSFAPWRRLPARQIKIISKLNRKLDRQIKTLDMKKRKSQFFKRTRAKKIMGLLYGKLHVSYLVRVYAEACAQEGGNVENFLATLEGRLDVTLYRVQFVPSLQAGRQLISHNKICVNNVILSKPGYLLKPGDVISIAPQAIAHVGQSIRHFLRAGNTRRALRHVGLVRNFHSRRRSIRRNKNGALSRALANERNTPSTCNRKWNEERYSLFPNVSSPVAKAIQKPLSTREAKKAVLKQKAEKEVQFAQKALALYKPSSQNKQKASVKALVHLKQRLVKRFTQVVCAQLKARRKVTLRLMFDVENNICLKRPKSNTSVFRFQRTSRGVPLHQWLQRKLRIKPYLKKRKAFKKLSSIFHSQIFNSKGVRVHWKARAKAKLKADIAAALAKVKAMLKTKFALKKDVKKNVILSSLNTLQQSQWVRKAPQAKREAALASAHAKVKALQKLKLVRKNGKWVRKHKIGKQKMYCVTKGYLGRAIQVARMLARNHAKNKHPVKKRALATKQALPRFIRKNNVLIRNKQALIQGAIRAKTPYKMRWARVKDKMVRQSFHHSKSARLDKEKRFRSAQLQLERSQPRMNKLIKRNGKWVRQNTKKIKPKAEWKAKRRMQMQYRFYHAVKQIFYKPTHLEISYHTLHIVYLFQPQYLYFPIKLELHDIAGAYKR